MRNKTKEPSLTDEPVGVPRTQHSALNNFSMIMFWMRKRKLSEDQLKKLENISAELLNEILAS